LIRALRRLTIAALGISALAFVAISVLAEVDPAAAQEPVPTASANPVIAWNRILLDIQAAPGDQPATIHPTYELAVMHAAINDAVVAADHRRPRLTSADAAADAAAHDTLVALYPSLRSTLDQDYATALAAVPAGRRKAAGIGVGQRAAAQILARRAGDGSGAAPLPFQPGSQPGDYQLTPPGFAAPVFTHWAQVRPFSLPRANAFRPPPPAPLTSAKYAAAIQEVQALGAAQGSTRTADQTQIGLFWNPPIWAAWNRIAQTAALAGHGSLEQDARTFAALDLTFADAVIAFYDAKYTYRFWRPVTAIRGAEGDGNPATTADPAWVPLSNTAPDPSYPGAHGTISAAGADVLAAMYGNDVAFTATSAALPGVERSFVSFSEAAQEASVSRIYNGNHSRLDEVAGENLGHDVAGFVLRHELRAR
jgi:PAP2 superfamily